MKHSTSFLSSGRKKETPKDAMKAKLKEMMEEAERELER
jgi:hypothetical protein